MKSLVFTDRKTGSQYVAEFDDDKVEAAKADAASKGYNAFEAAPYRYVHPTKGKGVTLIADQHAPDALPKLQAKGYTVERITIPAADGARQADVAVPSSEPAPSASTSPAAVTPGLSGLQAMTAQAVGPVVGPVAGMAPSAPQAPVVQPPAEPDLQPEPIAPGSPASAQAVVKSLIAEQVKKTKEGLAAVASVVMGGTRTPAAQSGRSIPGDRFNSELRAAPNSVVMDAREKLRQVAEMGATMGGPDARFGGSFADQGLTPTLGPFVNLAAAGAEGALRSSPTANLLAPGLTKKAIDTLAARQADYRLRQEAIRGGMVPDAEKLNVARAAGSAAGMLPVAMLPGGPLVTLPASTLAAQGADVATGAGEWDALAAAHSVASGAMLQFAPIPAMLKTPTGSAAARLGKVGARETLRTGQTLLLSPLTGQEVTPESAIETWLTFVMMNAPDMAKTGRAGMLESKLRDAGLDVEAAGIVANNAVYGEPVAKAEAIKKIQGIAKDKSIQQAFDEVVAIRGKIEAEREAKAGGFEIRDPNAAPSAQPEMLPESGKLMQRGLPRPDPAEAQKQRQIDAEIEGTLGRLREQLAQKAENDQGRARVAAFERRYGTTRSPATGQASGIPEPMTAEQARQALVRAAAGQSVEPVKPVVEPIAPVAEPVGKPPVAPPVRPVEPAKPPELMTPEEHRAFTQDGRFQLVGSRLRGENTEGSDYDWVGKLTPEEARELDKGSRRLPADVIAKYAKLNPPRKPKIGDVVIVVPSVNGANLIYRVSGPSARPQASRIVNDYASDIVMGLPKTSPKHPDKVVAPENWSINMTADFGHAFKIEKAMKSGMPVSASAVDSYGIKIPEGYVREGDRYVFRTPKKPTTTTSVVAPPAEPAKPPAASDSLAKAKAFLAGPLTTAEMAAANGESGKRPIRDPESGDIIDWKNQGSVYPKGWDKARSTQLAAAIRNTEAGKPLTEAQKRALDEASQAIDAEDQAFIERSEMQAVDAVKRAPAETVNEADIPVGSIIRVGNEWMEVRPEGTGKRLVDGETITLGDFDSIEAKGLLKPGDAGYDAALTEYRRQEQAKAKPPAAEPTKPPEVDRAGQQPEVSVIPEDQLFSQRRQLSSADIRGRYPSLPDEVVSRIGRVTIDSAGSRIPARNERTGNSYDIQAFSDRGVLHEIGHILEGVMPNRLWQEWKEINAKQGVRFGKAVNALPETTSLTPYGAAENLFTAFGLVHKMASGLPLGHSELRALEAAPLIRGFIEQNLIRTGYVREGDRYVFRSEPTKQPEVTRSGQQQLIPSADVAESFRLESPKPTIDGERVNQERAAKEAARKAEDAKHAGDLAEPPAKPTVADKALTMLDRLEQAARDDLDQLKRGGTLGANKPLGIAADYVIIGATKIARGAVKFSQWSAEMIADFGDSVKPHLRDIWAASRRIAALTAKSDDSRLDEVKAAAQAEGTKIARSLRTRNLSLMSSEPAVRRMFADVDTAMEAEGYPSPQTHAEWQQKADTIYAKSPEESYLSVVANKIDMADPVNQKLAMKAVGEQGAKDLASGSIERIQRAVAAAYNMRKAGTQLARAMGARRDPSANPEQRMRELITNLLVAPSESRAHAAATVNDAARMRMIRKTAEQTRKIIAKLREMGVDVTSLSDADLADRRKMSAILRTIQGVKSTWADVEFEWWRNAILSAPPTQFANLIGNSANGFYVFGLQKPVEAALNALTRNRVLTGTTAADVRETFKGMLAGRTWGDAFRNAVEAWSTEQPVTEGMKIEQAGTAIPGVAGRVIRTPQRMLLAADEFAKAVIVQTEIAGQAARIGRVKGLKGKDLRQFVTDQINDHESQAWMNAMKEAKDITFQGELGPVARRLMEMRKDGVTGFIMRHVVPFITTPTNILKTGIRRTPLGTLAIPFTVKKMLRGEATGGQALSQVAEQVLAWGAFMVVNAMANQKDDEGRPFITGSSASASASRGERDLQYRTFPPQRIRLPGGLWPSYARIEPFATSLSLMVDMLRQDGRSFTDKSVQSLTGLARDKTFMRGISDLIEMVEADKGYKIQQWTSNFAASYMPNVLRSSLRAFDPYVRQYVVEDPDDKWGEWLKATGRKVLPAEQFAPQPKIDLWGRDVEKAAIIGAPWLDGLYRALSPVDVVRVPSIENIDRMILNWNAAHPKEPWAPSYPASEVTINGKKVRLTEKQYHDLLKRRGEAALELADRFGRWNFDNPTEADRQKLTRLFSRASSIAKRKMGYDDDESGADPADILRAATEAMRARRQQNTTPATGSPATDARRRLLEAANR